MTENSKANRFYITTPIYYANDKPHIGHAYTDILTDVRARFERLCGREVMFLSGTDEHGQKMYRAALDKGRSPKEHADLNAANFKALLNSLNCSNDDFIRTTDPRHYASVEALWRKLNDNGDIYLDKYSGWYAVRDESYYDEGELTTLEDGSKVAPSGAEVTWIEEPSYFFRLTKYRDQLLKHYKDNPEFLIPSTRVNEVVSFIKSGLKDISISRVTFEWGVPVPKDASHAEDKSQHKHVVYVWLDALANYISALGYPDESDDRASFWQSAHHVVGKDILRFHGIYWPAFLISAGLNLPKHLFAHGWWTIEGQKMSKSVGNVVDPLDIIQRYGVDSLRYFLCREMSFGQDGDFSERALKARANADLANGLGNLAQRSLSMLWRHFDQKLPASIEEVDNAGKVLINDIKSFAAGDYQSNMRKMSFNRVLSDTAALVGAANRYIDALTPWTLVKQEDTKASAGQCLFAICESVRCFAILLSPFIPEASARLLDQLAIPDDQRNLSDVTTRCLQKDGELREPKPVFPRIT